MTPEQAARKFLDKASTVGFDDFGLYKEDHKELTEIIKSQRAEAVADFKERILRAIDSQTHSSELGDAYRHIRQLVGMLPPAQEGEG